MLSKVIVNILLLLFILSIVDFYSTEAITDDCNRVDKDDILMYQINCRGAEFKPNCNIECIDWRIDYPGRTLKRGRPYIHENPDVYAEVGTIVVEVDVNFFQKSIEPCNVNLTGADIQSNYERNNFSFYKPRHIDCYGETKINQYRRCSRWDGWYTHTYISGITFKRVWELCKKTLYCICEEEEDEYIDWDAAMGTCDAGECHQEPTNQQLKRITKNKVSK